MGGTFIILYPGKGIMNPGECTGLTHKVTIVSFTGNSSIVGGVSSTGCISAHLRSTSAASSHSSWCHPQPFVHGNPITVFEVPLRFPLLQEILAGSSSLESALPRVSSVIENSWSHRQKTQLNWFKQQRKFISSCNQKAHT